MNWIQERREAQPEKMAELVKKAEKLRYRRAGRDFLEAAGGDKDFALWMMLADGRVARRIGLGMFDIADWTWADAFESGTSPDEAAVEALSADDTFGGLF